MYYDISHKKFGKYGCKYISDVHDDESISIINITISHDYRDHINVLYSRELL